tara:strand:- start:480 stop:1190 length:711 start_codon:yes stop_codon:yes gene_type:complete
MSDEIQSKLDIYNTKIAHMKPLEIIEWAYQNFNSKFAFTTSFGIQSSVLLHIIQQSSFRNKVKIFWIDTGYLPKETYMYAEEIISKLSLNIEIVQSELSPARMEAIHGKLWESDQAKDLDKYHKIRKIDPLEKAFRKYSISCWASGVRAHQTNNRRQMKLIDTIRERLSLRPLLKWSNKDMFYYMEENKLPQHPLFLKGYSTIGDWHSSQAETQQNKGRETRFGGIKEECGLHTND